MKRLLAYSAMVASLSVICAVFADPGSYYSEIQSPSSAPVPEARFKAQEAEALQKFTQADQYRSLCLLFSNTTERVWAVVYGEVYVNLTQDEARRDEIATLVFKLYDGGIKVTDAASLGVSFSKYVEARQDGGVPFETNFEISLVVGLVSAGAGAKALTVKALSDARREQLQTWKDKGLPTTELIRWQQEVAIAGHFDAYNFWLFQAPRRDEFHSWRAQHNQEYARWLEWLAKNRFSPNMPDFHRVYAAESKSGNAG